MKNYLPFFYFKSVLSISIFTVLFTSCGTTRETGDFGGAGSFKFSEMPIYHTIPSKEDVKETEEVISSQVSQSKIEKSKFLITKIVKPSKSILTLKKAEISSIKSLKNYQIIPKAVIQKLKINRFGDSQFWEKFFVACLGIGLLGCFGAYLLLKDWWTVGNELSFKAAMIVLLICVPIGIIGVLGAIFSKKNS